MRALLVFVLAGCQTGTPAGDPADPVAEVPTAATRDAPAPAPALSTADPLAGCDETAIDRTTSWTCGPHRIVVARHPDGLPPERPGTYGDNAPEQTTRPVSVGERTLQATVLTQPREDGEGMVSLVVRDEDGGRVASCALALRRGQDAEGPTAWCVAALGTVLGEEGR